MADAAIQGNDMRGHLKATPKDQFHTTVPAEYEDMLKALTAANVSFQIKKEENNALWPTLVGCAPDGGDRRTFFFMLRQMQSGGNKAMSFGKSRARLLSMQQKKGDLQGCGRSR